MKKTQIEPTNERGGKSTETDIKCSCGKLIAKERGGKIYLWCKSCRREVELEFEKESRWSHENSETRGTT